MRLVIDARFTRTDRHDGISRYGASLIAAIAEHSEVTMLISDDRQLALLPDVPYVKINSPLSPRELFVARRINKLRPDVVFCPMQTMGSWGRKYGLILTLHDLIYYQHPAPPSFLPLPVRVLWRLYHRAYWPQRLLLNRADAVATISKTTKLMIERHRLTRRPIELISNAPQPSRQPRDPAVAPERTILYMGSFMPYKNVETLIKAMALLPEYSLQLLSKITPARRAELTKLIPLGAAVTFADGVSDADYELLLRQATALATLSRAEGYGLPLIEAMALGTPVIASDIDIFREVGGEAASYVSPDSADEFAEAVRALDSAELWGRRSAQGVQRARQYNWDRSAQQLIAVAEQTLARRRAASGSH